MTRQRLLSAAVIVGCWTCIAILFTPQSYVANRMSPSPLPAWVAVAAQAAIFFVWAALTPLVLLLVRRFPFRRGRFLLAFVEHVIASFVVGALHIVAVSFVQSLLPVPRAHQGPMPPELMLVSIIASNVMLYWTMVAVATAIDYFRRDRRREVALMQAQLESLRNRLQPHFLFNTLNAIAELMYADPKRAEETLTQLSDVLRLTLQHDQQHEITLGEEVALLRKHVGIYQTLLQDRLQVRWSIDDDAMQARVPTMILQPLVENAIRHGIAPRERGGLVSVSARRDDGCLHLTVEDDGVGMPRGVVRTGVGLANTRSRLRHLYGDAYAFELRQPDGGGTVVGMRLPLR